ncbi:MAG: hypothetical protein IKB51_01740 [Clostridia bacterium]|nr:hypothetical protein [Clostridia bacterium]
MNSKTLVCAYGKARDIQEVFTRLYAMYKLNFSESYAYCALIDLEDACLYRMAGDSEAEMRAERAAQRLNELCGGGFFCGIRQRRCEITGTMRRYTCEGGALGALKALWRYTSGRNDELFPCYGTLDSGFERVFFSARKESPKTANRIYGCDGRDFLKHNIENFSAKSSEKYFEVIEPSGIFRLAEGLKNSGAVFAESDLNGLNDGIFSAWALDLMLSDMVRPQDITSHTEKNVGFCRVSIETLGSYKKSAR